MKDYRKDFRSFENRIWLNAASEGPLPLVADEALQDAVKWKSLPYLLDHHRFVSVPKGLKESIGRLIGVNPRDVILGNSASYGIHLLANGIPWGQGDEIILMQNDFPTDILPWLALQERGVKVRQIQAKDKVLTPEELLENITEKTKLFCISHVHTFSGYVLDVDGFAQICQDKGVLFVLNLSQSVGNRPVDITKFPVDAVIAAGYKWLCGPYGTGFCWMKPALRDQLTLNQAYWVSLMSEEELKDEGPLQLGNMKTARKFDVFGTANFFNFVPFKAAIDYWLEAGLENVFAYNNRLIDRIISGLDESRYDLVSPKEGKWRSSLVVISHKDKKRNKKIYASLTSQNIYTALWKDNIRIAAHVYNTEEQIDIFLKALHKEIS